MCSFRLALARSAVCPHAGAPVPVLESNVGLPRVRLCMCLLAVDLGEECLWSRPIQMLLRRNPWGNHEAAGEKGPVRVWGPGPAEAGAGRGWGQNQRQGRAIPLQWGGENPAGVGLQLGVALMWLRDMGGRAVRWGTSEGRALRPGSWRCDVVTGRWVSTGDESAEAGDHSVSHSSLLGSETLPRSRCRGIRVPAVGPGGLQHPLLGKSYMPCHGVTLPTLQAAPRTEKAGLAHTST